MSMNLGNYLTSILAGRTLSSLTFASYVGLTSLISIVTTVSGLTQPLIANSVARSISDRSRLSIVIDSILSRVATLIIFLAVVWILFLPLIFQLFTDETTLALSLSLFFVGLATLLPALVGLSLGLLNFKIFSLSFFLGGLSRPFFFWIIQAFTTSLIAPLLALILSLFITCLILILGLPHSRRAINKLMQPQRFVPNLQLFSTSVIILTIAVLSYSDTIAARLNLSGEEAGLFAAASVLTNISLYGGIIVASVLVPTAAANFKDKNRSILLARWSIYLVLAFGALYSAILGKWGNRILGITFGNRFDVDSSFLVFYNIVFVGIAVCTLISNYSVNSQTHFKSAISFALVGIFYLISLVIYGNSRMQIVTIEGIAVMMFILLSLFNSESLLRVACKRSNTI